MNARVKEGISRLFRWGKKHRSRLGGSFFEYAAVTVLFVILTIFYSAGAVLRGNDTLFVAGPGDGTAGLLWMLSVDKGWSPVPPHTDMVNYPDGADLASPLQITAILIQTPAWLLSRFMPAMMAVNIMLLLAFTLIGVLGYWLLKRLTGKWYIAFFAGFVLAFMPYHIFKSVAHIANIFSWMFVATIAASIYLWRLPSWKSAVLLALTVVAGYYTDGYYLLLSSVFVVTLSMGGLFAKYIAARQYLLVYLRYLLVAAGCVVLFALPIVATQLIAGKQASGELASARSDIKTEAHYYAAWGLDYVTPPQVNPFFENIPAYQKAHAEKGVRSNPPESALYIGYVILVLCIFGVGLAGWLLSMKVRGKRTPRVLTARDNTLHLLLTSFVLVTVPVLLSLMGPLDRTIFGVHIPMLSGILTDHIALWRVLTRFILPLHALLAVYAAFSLYIGMKIVAGRFKVRESVLVGTALALLLAVAVEYATGINRPPFTLRDMPAMYWHIKQDENVKVLAELPITDKPVEVNGYYATAQLVHGKKLVNNHVSKYNDGEMTALGDESNPETIDYLKRRGADHVITRGAMCKEQPWGKLERVETIEKGKHTPPEYSGRNYSVMCLYSLAGEPASGDEMVAAVDLSDLMNAAGQTAGVYETYARIPSVTLRIEGHVGSESSAKVLVEVYSRSSTNYLWSASQAGVFLVGGVMGGGERKMLSIDTTNIHDPVELSFAPIDGSKYEPGDVVLNKYQATSR